MEMRTNIKTNGNKTKNQAIPGAPARHIKLRIHVQNKIYIALIMNIMAVLDTVHD